MVVSVLCIYVCMCKHVCVYLCQQCRMWVLIPLSPSTRNCFYRQLIFRNPIVFQHACIVVSVLCIYVCTCKHVCMYVCVSSDVARYGERSRVILLTKMPRLTTYICITHPGISLRETAYLIHHQSCVFPI
jgi:hypothetical protein